MAVLQGYNASIQIASGTSVAFANEATTANADRTEYAIHDAAKRYWDRLAVFAVERSTDNGTTWNVVPTSEYALIHVGGLVKFASAQAAGTLVRVSGRYLPVSTVGQAKEWSLDLSLNMEDASVFGDGWKTYTPLQASASASLSRWWLDGAFLGLLRSLMVLILYLDATRRYEAYAYLTRDSVQAATSGNIEEPLEFEIDGQVFYRA